MKKKTYRLSGSYTVEASFIFPMIMLVILMILYLMFYVHDKCVMNAAADAAALRASQPGVEEKGIYESAENNVKELLNKRLLASGSVENKVKITSDTIEVVCRSELPIPFHNIRIPVEVIGYAKRTDPVTFIRECRVIEEKAEGW